jgi:hypothetical protein
MLLYRIIFAIGSHEGKFFVKGTQKIRILQYSGIRKNCMDLKQQSNSMKKPDFLLQNRLLNNRSINEIFSRLFCQKRFIMKNKN